jgi:hypothetical protein
MNNNQNCAEAMDLMNTRIAIGLLLASITYALDASIYLFTDGNNQVFKWIGFTTSLLAAAWIFRAIGPMLWNKFKSRSMKFQEPESFVTETLHKAIIKSWTITIAALMVLKVSERMISRVGLPIEFYINALVFIMLFSASVIFLVMTRFNDADDKPEELA